MTVSERTRTEKDSMGSMEVPIEAYYGASTQRAVLNFINSGLRFPRSFIRALALIKYAAAEVNQEFGEIPDNIAKAIKQAAMETADGKFDDQFVIDIFQTGSGTSTNMNANEVIANRAIEILGSKRGDRSLVHPNDHVNTGMSSNDAIPTAIHLAALLDIQNNLLPSLSKLQRALSAKAQEFMPVIKTGRTHLQDATPIRLGQEFVGFTGQIERAILRLMHAQERLCEVALGGTAVGTGINTHRDFSRKVCGKVSKLAGVTIRETSNHFQAQSTLDEVVETSGILKTIAVSLLKIANDIRLMSCGPRAGFAEIALPEVQPGSSIMPGKVNPVIAEAVAMVGAQVIGNDVTITIAGQSGNFELNVMQPVAAYNLLQSINLLADVCGNFAEKCVAGIKATSKGPEMVEKGLALCTALVPEIGYDKAAEISHIAHNTGTTVREVARKQTNLSEEDLNRIFDPAKMTDSI